MLPIAHSESRIFTTYPGSQYVFPSDETERIRLIRQHYMLKRALGNKLILPPISIKPGDEVLDSGTGSGVWVLDFSNENPSSVQVYGTDIESRIFPPVDTRPSNTHFITASLFSLPSEWTSKFTFVHQRCVFTVAIPIADVPTGLSELHRVLKPGGWVQLLEPGDWVAGPATERHKNLIRKFSSARGIDFHCYKIMSQLLADAGFQNVKVVVCSTANGKWAGEEGLWGRYNLMTLWRGIKVPILENGGFGFVNSEEEMDRLLDDIEKETDETEGAKSEWWSFYAQKPL